jgi:transposase
MTHAERRDRRKAIAEDARAGMGVAELVEKYGVCYGVVHRACADEGVRILKSRAHPLSATTYHVLAELFRPGVSLRTVSEKFHVSRERVHQIYRNARDAGIPVPARPRTGASCATAQDAPPGTSA